MNLKFNHPQHMKKFLLTMVIALLGFAIPGRGAESTSVILDFNFSGTISDCPTSSSTDVSNWSFSNYNFTSTRTYKNSQNKYLMIASSGYLKLPTFANQKVNSITVYCSSGISTSTKMSLKQGSSTGSQIGNTYTGVKSGNNTFTVNATSTNIDYYLTVSSANFQCEKIVINLVDDSNPYNPPFANQNYTLKVGETKDLGVTSEAPGISYTFGGDGIISINNDIVEGKKAGGPIEVTATWSAEKGYDKGSATFEVTVIDNSQGGGDIGGEGEKGTKLNPYKVSDVIDKTASGDVWVIGYIIGTASSKSSLNSSDVDTNIAIADDLNSSNFIPVKLAAGDKRNAINIKDNPANKYKQIKIYGTIGTYFTTNGITDVKDYEFVVSDPTPKEYTALDQYDNDTDNITFELGGYYQLQLGEEHPDITWEYDPDGIITIDANGKITATSEASADDLVDVVATWGDNNTWKEGSVNFFVTVTDNQGGEVTPPTPGEYATAIFYAQASNDDEADYKVSFNGEGNISGTSSTAKKFEAGDIVVWIEKKNTSNTSNVNGDEVRWYADDYLHIEPINNAKIKSVNITTISKYSKINDINNSYGRGFTKDLIYTWTGEIDKDLILSNSAQTRFNKIVVEYEPPFVPTPEFPVVKIGEEELADNGSKTVAKGTEITISSENAKSIKVQYESDMLETLSQEPFTFPIIKSGKYTIWGVNGRQEGEKFTYTFIIGEVDPNMPAPGSTFKQVKSLDELEEGCYVIANVDKGLAMGSAEDTSNYVRITPTDQISMEKISTGTQDFNLLTANEGVLILYLEKRGEEYGLKTLNYKDGFLNSQGYLANETGNNLEPIGEFTPISFEFTKLGNTDIKFESGSKISINNNGTYFNCAGGNAIQLYKYTTARKFEPDFENPLAIPQGESRQMKPKNEKYPSSIQYRVIGKTTVISVEEGSDKVQSNPDRTSDELQDHPYIEASWDESDEWFGGNTRFQVIVKYYLNAKQFGFEYDVIRGKKDVGVAAQAARYLGTGKVEYRVYDVYDIETQTFVETPETELRINHETGMIRPEDIVNAKLNKDYIVVATVDETEEHMSAYRSYIIRIEDFTPPTVSNKATFDFTSSGSYGLFAFDGTNQKNSKGEEVFEGNIEEQFDSRYQDHTSVSTIYADEDKNISLKFTGKYRDWTGTGNDYHLRVYSESTMSISVPEGYSISSIEFSSPNSTANGNNFTTSISSKDNIWSDGNSKWNAPNGGINTLTFTANATIRISQITVTIDAPNHGEKTLSTLSFPEDARLYNIFEGETETISGLTSSAVPFELIEYDIDNVEGINGNLDEDEYEQDPFTNYVINPKWNDEKNAVDIDVTVNTPGIYTFRAYNESDDQYYAGMAILRLNVFPRLEVLPKSDNDLAEDERTEHPQLTLVNHDDEEKATIKLPNLNSLKNDYKYSTVTLNVEVKHGEDIQKYSSLDEESIPESFVFKQDGYVKYEMLYANTDDFKKEETVHVVLMPSWNFTADSNSITIIPTANSTLQYCYFQTRYYDENGRKPGEYGESTKKGVKARTATEEVVREWETANKATTFSVDDSGFEHTDGYWIGVKYRTVKNVNDITDLDLEDPILASDYNTILFTDSGIPTGIDDIHTDFSDFESEGEAVYFNLQGQKVNKPEKGVYIIVKDGKAEKVVL